ncbi:hypothetical protein Hanom_Chr14g01260791 [Helianthus anomalus]
MDFIFTLKFPLPPSLSLSLCLSLSICSSHTPTATLTTSACYSLTRFDRFPPRCLQLDSCFCCLRSILLRVSTSLETTCYASEVPFRVSCWGFVLVFTICCCMVFFGICDDVTIMFIVDPLWLMAHRRPLAMMLILA